MMWAAESVDSLRPRVLFFLFATDGERSPSEGWGDGELSLSVVPSFCYYLWPRLLSFVFCFLYWLA